MDEEQLKAMLGEIESSWQQQSDNLMAGYMEQYKELSRKAAADMQEMIANATQHMSDLQPKPEVVHMKWMEVNGQNVLLLSEQAGKDILNCFDVLGRLLPELEKRLKQHK